MKVILASCLLLFGCSTTRHEFPHDYTGHWEGQLHWYQVGKKQPQKVKMQLIIRPADTIGHYSWQLIYGDKNADNRPYVLKPIDTSRGHWIVDEKNGIILDQYFAGNKLTGAFTVQGTTIVNTYWLQGKKLYAEFYSFPSEASRISGGTEKDIPPVHSYSLKAFQHAVLKRRK